jgi:hypothetical protein
VKEGVLEKLLRGLAEDLKSRGRLDLTEAFIDGSHAGAQRGPLVGITRRGKATRIMAAADRAGLPLDIWIASGPRNETKFAGELVRCPLHPGAADEMGRRPAATIAIHSTRELKKRGIEMIAPNLCSGAI